MSGEIERFYSAQFPPVLAIFPDQGALLKSCGTLAFFFLKKPAKGLHISKAQFVTNFGGGFIGIRQKPFGFQKFAVLNVLQGAFTSQLLEEVGQGLGGFVQKRRILSH